MQFITIRINHKCSLHRIFECEIEEKKRNEETTKLSHVCHFLSLFLHWFSWSIAKENFYWTIIIHDHFEKTFHIHLILFHSYIYIFTHWQMSDLVLQTFLLLFDNRIITLTKRWAIITNVMFTYISSSLFNIDRQGRLIDESNRVFFFFFFVSVC